jgi:hypothetical protein
MIIINKTYQKLCKLAQDNFIDVQAWQKKFHMILWKLDYIVFINKIDHHIVSYNST